MFMFTGGYKGVLCAHHSLTVTLCMNQPSLKIRRTYTTYSLAQSFSSPHLLHCKKGIRYKAVYEKEGRAFMYGFVLNQCIYKITSLLIKQWKSVMRSLFMHLFTFKFFQKSFLATINVKLNLIMICLCSQKNKMQSNVCKKFDLNLGTSQIFLANFVFITTAELLIGMLVQ